MKIPYTGEERRKTNLLEQFSKRVTMLELNADRQAEMLELVTGHLNTQVRALELEVVKMKDICRSCACFQDDFK